jgi:acyl carrier protein
MKKINSKDLKLLLKKTFPNSKIPNNIIKLKIGKIKEWDSLGNFNFLLAIENFYKIRFTIDEISKIRSIQEIIYSIKKK